jgi:predicted DNA-binding transcriptional regulator YafY
MCANLSLPASRPPLERMLKIHEALQDGAQVNCRWLEKELEISSKTANRDLVFMRDRLGLPLEYDPRTYTWRYTYPVKSFPTVQVSEGELLALLVAQKALEQYRGTPYHDQLAAAFDKLSAGLREKVSFSATGSLSKVSFHQPGQGKADLTVFNGLSRAVMQNLEVRFNYQKPTGTRPESRHVRPYHLANRENSWYLIAYDLQREAIRNFSVARMSALEVLGRTFERPADFSAEKHFAKAFGAYVGTGDYVVVIRFSAAVAPQIKERIWHESQDMRDLPSGGLEISLRLDSLEEIRRWVLGWGNEAEVLRPAELIAEVKATAEAIRRKY